MIKIYCDRCGKRLDEHSKFTLTVDVPELVQNRLYAYTVPLDLCEGCMMNVFDSIDACRRQMNDK